MFALSGCRCLSSVDEQTADAGLSGDGGALTRDGGALSRDGGVLSSDGGVFNGDGGSLDSGSPVADAGPSVDAGTTGRDAGTVGVDGGVGNTDAGTPIAEVCDGIDNDLDGLTDEAPDGTPLSRDCRLSLGVCLNVKSPCVDGGYQACDYGPHYQLTEHNCDGLDNDCDGRVDKSWVRTLSKAGSDGGATFWWGETTYQQLSRVGGRFILNLPASVLALDDDLQITMQVTFPRYTPIGMGRLIPAPDGDGWQRVFYEDKNAFSCVDAHRLYADGGYPTIPNGDLVFSARACASSFKQPQFGPLAAVSPSGGIATVDRPAPSPAGPNRGWAAPGQRASTPRIGPSAS